MSGRIVIVLTLSVCLSLVGVALWQRSTGTSRVRAFWGAHGAALIQHAPQVEVMALRKDAITPWRDVSHAPGLIHLRATLVDDRYYQWPATSLKPLEGTTTWLFRFTRNGSAIELNIDTADGLVSHPKTQQAVKLIDASRQAIAAYLAEILKEME